VQRLVARAVSEQAGHADLERVVVLEYVLAAERMTDRGVQPGRQFEHLVPRVGAADPAEDHDFLGGADAAGHLRHGRGIRRRPGGYRHGGAGVDTSGSVAGQDVAGQHEHGRAAFAYRGLDGFAGQPLDLAGVGDGLAEVAGLREQGFGFGLLEVAGADLAAGYVGGQGQHRCPGPVGVHDALDQVGVARAATAGAYRKRSGQLGLGGGREGGTLLVMDMHPVDAARGRSAAAAHGVTEGVEAVSDNPVDAPHSRLHQHVEKAVSHGVFHDSPSGGGCAGAAAVLITGYEGR
jgi:hypothetical protein